MKKLIAFISTALLSVSLFGLDIFNYVPLTGDISSYTQTDYTITSKFGDLFRTPSVKILHNFQEGTSDGELKESDSVEMTARDVLLNRTEYNYDEDDNLVEVSYYDAALNLIWKNVMTYNEGNQKIDSSEYDRTGALKSRTIYSYGKDGNLAKESGYDGDGALLWKIVYKYADDELTNLIQYAADGSLTSEESYTYTDDGRLETIVTFDNFTKKTEQKLFRYTSSGTLTEITTYDENKQITVRLMIKYDADGNVSRLSTYNISYKFGSVENELVAMSEFSYNDVASSKVASDIVTAASAAASVRDAK
ncbi:MAG: hypothetical protein MJ188_08180 [Treponema sp.]|nr:hypothetical protein [Treponema sp.]